MKNINALNLLLLAAVIAFAAYILPPLLEVNVAYTLPAPKKVSEEKEEKPAAAQPPSVMGYTVIAEQNVFNPERKIPAEKKDDQPLPKPEFVLYGTLIAGDTSMAFMEDLKAPYTTVSRGKRQRTLRLGGNISGFTLSQIYQDRVIMARGDERVEVRVMDTTRAKARNGGAVPAVPQAFAPPATASAPGAVASGQPPVTRSQPSRTSDLQRQRLLRPQ